MNYKIIIIFLLLLISACSEKEEEVIVEKTGIEIKALGSINFGGILVGNQKDAAIEIHNYGPNTVPIELELTAPFNIQSVSRSCQDGFLDANEKCILAIRYTPLSSNSEGDTFVYEVGNKSITFTGRGLVDGVLELAEDEWSLGEIEAGTLSRKFFTIRNLGDITVATPTFDFPSFIQIGRNECGGFISPRSECRLELEATPLVAGLDNISIESDGNSGSLTLNYSAEVIPSIPSGLIRFASSPSSMDAAGEEFVIETDPIIDEFGNTVSENTNINVSVNENLLLLDGENYPTDSNGKISFRIRTVTNKGSGAVSVSAGQASGFVNFPITSGPAFGEIEFRDFTTNVPANNVAQVVINTKIIRDQFDNVVEDGMEVLFELDGPGSISSNIESPKTFTNTTFNGETFVVLKAGTLAEKATLIVKSGPIRNTLGEIVGYSANGEAEVHFEAGPGAGDIDVNPTLNAIYSERNPPGDISINSETIVSIGPVKDQFGNIVKEGSEVEISIENGLNISGSAPEEESVLLTDENGFAFFNLVGKGNRGYINIEARSGLGTGDSRVWAYKRSRVSFDSGNTETNPVEVSFLHNSSKQNPVIMNNNWAASPDATTLASLDGVFYGFEKESSPLKTSFSQSEGVPFYNWDCFFTGGTFLYASFCRQEDGFFSPLLRYTQNHRLEFDALDQSSGTNLVPNGDFNSGDQAQGWDNSAGATWSDSFNGTLEVDNSSAPASGERKRRGESVWIEIDDSKKYVLRVRMAGRFGSDNSGDGEVGIIESDGDLYLDEAFETPFPSIIFTDELKENDLNIEQRFIYTPPMGVEAIKVYLSTKDTGNGAITLWDDVSLEELSSENFHNNEVKEGPSFAFIEEQDRALVVGGTALIEEPGPFFFGSTVDTVTALDDILDRSIGVIKTPLDPATGQDFGETPIPRGHSAIDSRDGSVYIYGGYDNSIAEGQARDDLLRFNGETSKWSEIELNPDPSLYNAEDDMGGTPGKRYQHGMVFLPEYNKFFVAGGLEYQEDSEGGIFWEARDDFWIGSLDTNEWSRICEDCGLFSSNPYSVLADFQKPLEDFPEISQRKEDYEEARLAVKRSKFVWHEATHKLYFYTPETSFIKGYDPLTEEFFDSSSFLSSQSILSVDDPYQILYNRNLGRTYVYQRGDIGLENSKIYYWDMNPDEKQYLRVSFDLEEEAKDFLQELKVSAYAYGGSLTVRNFGDVVNTGVEMYIYNHFNNSWRFLTSNSASNSIEAQDQPLERFLNDINISDFVSEEGKIDVLLTPVGRPGFDGGEILMGDDLDFINVGTDDNLNDLLSKKVVSMNQATCSLFNNDKVKCWGRNNKGQLGLGTSSTSEGESSGEMGDNLEFLELFDENLTINSSLKVVDIFAGVDSACALFNNDNIKCWGSNDRGQLGIGNTSNKGTGFSDMGENLPFVDLGTKDGTAGTSQVEVQKVSIGEKHACALVKINDFGTKNRVKCWGDNQYGQLGYGDNQVRGDESGEMGNNLPFIEFGPIFDSSINDTREVSIKDITTGSFHTCVVWEDDRVRCWGLNDKGQLGQENTNDSSIPLVLNLNFDEILSIKSGSYHTCALGIEGTISKLKCWGLNDKGQLGIGSTENIGDNSNEMGINLAEVRASTSFGIVDMELGDEHSCVILESDETKCFGSNLFGQLSYGPDTDFFGIEIEQMEDSLPIVDLGTDLFAKQLSAGGDNTCALLNNDKLKCWGANGFGQLGQEDTRGRGRGLSTSEGRNNLMIDFIEIEGIY